MAANRANSKKSSGPRDTTSTRFNATKHGLLAAGITELDDAAGYRDALRRLGAAYLAELDAFLVERIALYVVRLRRTARLEAEFITSVLNPPTYSEGPFNLSSLGRIVLDPRLRASLASDAVKALVSTSKGTSLQTKTNSTGLSISLSESDEFNKGRVCQPNPG